MTTEQFKFLHRGSVIKNRNAGIAVVIDECHASFIIAMKTILIDDPSEWELCASESSGAVDNSTQQTQLAIAAQELLARFKGKVYGEDFIILFNNLRDALQQQAGA